MIVVNLLSFNVTNLTNPNIITATFTTRIHRYSTTYRDMWNQTLLKMRKKRNNEISCRKLIKREKRRKNTYIFESVGSMEDNGKTLIPRISFIFHADSYPYLRIHFPADVSHFGMLLSNCDALNTLDLYLWISASPHAARHVYFSNLWKSESRVPPSLPKLRFLFSQSSTRFLRTVILLGPRVLERKKRFYRGVCVAKFDERGRTRFLGKLPLSSPFVNRYQKLF